MTIAISFDGNQLETERPIGIDVATRDFIRGHFRFGHQEKFYCVCPNIDAFELYKKYAQDEGIERERCLSINQNDPEGLEKAQCLLRYDPGIVRNAWARRHHGQRLYSLCGVAHSIASAEVMEVVGSYLSSPLQSWDALICPSKAIRSAIQSIITAWEGNFKERFGHEFNCPLELPIIPLGVDTARLKNTASPYNRTQQRNLLGIPDDEIILLYVGRLNYIAKANPLPLLIAAEEVAKNSANPLHIVFNGYFNDPANENAFNQAISNFCQNVNVTFVKHGDPKFPNGVWAAGDIFCSLSDNIQESFGLTPIEAMASGLPTIVSDWDGYRDTVRNGIDGITIPTYMPSAGTGREIAYRYFSGQYSYGDYLGATSQSISVDIPSLVTAISLLSKDSEKRRTMGNAGKRRASEYFDWSHIIAAYEELWNELTVRRKHANEEMPLLKGDNFHPSRQDPFIIFREFPTKTIFINGRVSLLTENWQETLKRISLKMSLILPNNLMELEKIPALIAQIEAQPDSTLEQIASALEENNQARFVMTIGWLLKLGIFQYHAPEGDP